MPETSADEVLLLLEEYREAQRMKDTSEPLKKLFQQAEATAKELEFALRAKKFVVAEKQYLVALGQCTTCHNQERDNSSNR